jgi:hypothetical protein
MFSLNSIKLLVFFSGDIMCFPWGYEENFMYCLMWKKFIFKASICKVLLKCKRKSERHEFKHFHVPLFSLTF